MDKLCPINNLNFNYLVESLKERGRYTIGEGELEVKGAITKTTKYKSVLTEITIDKMGNERKMNIRIHNSDSE